MSLRCNKEGYRDPTACVAISNADKVDERIPGLVRTIHYICDLCGFRVDGRIVLVDKKTGRMYR